MRTLTFELNITEGHVWYLKTKNDRFSLNVSCQCVCANKWFKTEGQSYLWAAMHQTALDGQWSEQILILPPLKHHFQKNKVMIFSNRYFRASFENVFFYKFSLKSFNFDSNYFISHDLCIRQKSRSANRIECFFTTWTTLNHSINVFKYILIIKSFK